jgi:hypothetical protein
MPMTKPGRTIMRFGAKWKCHDGEKSRGSGPVASSFETRPRGRSSQDEVCQTLIPQENFLSRRTHYRGWVCRFAVMEETLRVPRDDGQFI